PAAERCWFGARVEDNASLTSPTFAGAVRSAFDQAPTRGEIRVLLRQGPDRAQMVPLHWPNSCSIPLPLRGFDLGGGVAGAGGAVAGHFGAQAGVGGWVEQGGDLVCVQMRGHAWVGGQQLGEGAAFDKG